MTLKSCSKASFIDLNTEKSVQESQHQKMCESDLKYNLEEPHKQLSKRNPQLSIRSRNLIWKPKISINADLCESNYSPIAKRLYSLVNSNNVSPCQVSVANSNCTPINFIISNNIPKNDPITVNKSTFTENNADINHNKLRGFLKQISVEKSGLPILSSFNIINRSLKLKMKKDSSKTVQKLKVKESKSSGSINKNPIVSVSDQIKIETCSKVKDKNSPLDILKSSNKPINKNLLKFTNSVSGLAYNRTFQNANINSSNCVDVKFQNHVPYNKSLNSSQHTARSISIVKNYKQNLLEEYDLKDSVDYNLKQSKNFKSKLNTHTSTVSLEKEKSIKFENKTKIKVDSIKGSVNQKKYEVDSLMSDVPDSQSMNNSIVVNQSNGPIKFNYKDTDEKLNNHLNKGNSEIKSKNIFSKRIFKIFSQSGYMSNKKKLMKNSSETVFGITSDTLINLISILLVELILSTTKRKPVQSHERSTDKINSNLNSTKTFPNNSTLDNVINKNLKTFAKTQITPRSAFHKSNTPLKKSTLTFDFNGRVVKDQENNAQIRPKNYLRHGSLSNLHGKPGINSLTLSIPVRHSQDNQLFRLQKNPFQTNDKNSVNCNNLRRKNLNKYVLCQDYQVNEKRENCKLFNTKSYNIAENRKLNNQQTYQFKPLSENLKSKNKGDCLNSHNRLPIKFNLNPSISKGNNSDSSKLYTELNKQNLSEIDLIDDNIEKGNYKFFTQIKSKINFLMLDEIFELKEELYSKCGKSMIYIRQKNKLKNMNSNMINKTGNECWFLYVESPTSEALKNSLKIIASRFPEWNLQQYINN